MNKGLITLLGLLLAWSAAGAQTTWYVAPNGSDAADGASTNTPLATPSNAVSRVYALNDTTSPKTICLRGGKYYDVNLLMYWQRYNYLTICSYPGERAELYGGVLVTNWTDQGSGVWSAPLPTLPASVTYSNQGFSYWMPRMLWANGTNVTWAAYPDLSSPTNKLWYDSLTYSNMVYTNTMEGSTNYEICIDNSWTDGNFLINAIDTGTKTITLPNTPSRWASLGNLLAHSPYRLRNCPEGLTHDNMFWWNKTNNVIYYRPPAGADPNTIEVVAPAALSILQFRGYDAENHMKGIVLSNLTFVATTQKVLGPAEFGQAANFYQNGVAGSTYSAVYTDHTTNFVVDGCWFLGGAGAAYHGLNGSGTVFRNCIVRDYGAYGVRPGGVSSSVSNNLVEKCGWITQSGCGIMVGVSGVASSNAVSDCFGAGIVAQPTGATDSVIRNNNVTNCVRALRDMGAIYTYGNTNVQIISNLVVNVYGSNINSGDIWCHFKHAIYVDAYSTNNSITHNVTLNCEKPFQHNSNWYSRFANNFFLFFQTNAALWVCVADSGAERVHTNNVYYAPNTRFWSYMYNGSTVNWNKDAIRSWNTNEYFWCGDNSNNPTNVTTVDPQFYNSSPVLLDSSPLLAAGVIPLWGTHSGTIYNKTFGIGTWGISSH